MSFVVELSPTAETDLEHLFDFFLDQAETSEDLDRAQAAIDAVRATAQHRLAITPFSFRKAVQNPAQRELIIPLALSKRNHRCSLKNKSSFPRQSKKSSPFTSM